MPKIAAIQMCSSNEVDDNLIVAKKLMKEAAEHGAKIVVLPEMFAMIGLAASKEIIKVQEDYKGGRIQEFLATEALKNNIWIVGGTIPISCKDKNKIRAACIVYDNKGLAVARYDKIHLFDVTLSKDEAYRESDTVEEGDQLAVVDTPLGKLGIAVCYDIRFPAMFTKLCNQGAEIIAIPAAFTVSTGEAHWKLLARSRAVENFCYVVGAAQGGTHKSGRNTYGHSVIVEPWGAIISEKIEQGPGVIYGTIDLSHLHKIRASIPVHKHQKLDLDIYKNS